MEMKILNLRNSFLAILVLLNNVSFAAIDTPQSILNMNIKENGVYRVTYDDVVAQGINLSGISKSKLSIINNGIPVPIKIFSNNQTTFEPGDFIEFVGKNGNSLYQEGSIYSLIISQGLRINDNRTLPNDTQLPELYYMHREYYGDNKTYNFGSPTEDPWYDKRILAIGSEVNESIYFNIDNLVNIGEVELSVNIWGGTDYPQTPDHHVIYTLNGTVIDDFRFDGLVNVSNQYLMETSSLFDGVHELKITVPNDTNTTADVIYINSWQVNYPRAFVLKNSKLHYDTLVKSIGAGDLIFSNGFEESTKTYYLSNANNETYRVYVVMENGTVESYQSETSVSCHELNSQDCLLKFTLNNNSNGEVFVSSESELMTPEYLIPVMLSDIKQDRNVDYLIISHPDFIGESLNQFVADKQLNAEVLLVDIEQIYAQFGDWNVSADSIKQYIGYARNEFSVKNVLLVGGDTYDYKNYLNSGSISFIPTLYAQTDEYIRYAPVDAKFTDMDDDNIPDFNIGRFPVRTESELDNLIDKINLYNNKTYNNTAVFAADKLDTSTGYSFKDDAELLISMLPELWQNNIGYDQRAYVDDDGVDLAKSKIANNINQGIALTSFIGHSGPRDWSFSRLFSTGDANALFNSESPTLVTQWGCWNTYFVSPTEDTLAHAFMLNQNGGAASVLGASTLTKAEHEQGLAQLVLKHLTHDSMTLGDAVTNAKRVYSVTHPDALDVILGWNILGDPDLRL